MSKGMSNITLDGINLKWFEKTAADLLTGKYSFSPALRVMIPKPGKKEKRPLSVANLRDKIIQKALAVVLEAIWEEFFSDYSYGFRPKRSLHQALYQLYRNGAGYQWVIQGDISKCFDNIPHEIIMKIIGKKVVCEKTTQLIRKSLNAGYIDPENGVFVKTRMGTPQGCVLSPLLANIVLNELDQYLEKYRSSFEIWKKRKRNKMYDAITSKIQNLQKYQPGSAQIKTLAKMKRTIPSVMYEDPDFKRMMFLRYAEDFVVLIAGSSDDAHKIRNNIKDYLNKKCGLELNLDKTLITNTRDGFNFLGAHCIKPRSIKAGLFKSNRGRPAKYRMRMRIMIPMKSVIQRLTTNKFVKINEVNIPCPTARKDLVNFEHHEIVTFYNHRIQGLVNFYSFAHNFNSLRKIIMFLQFSCALTLALKLKVRTKRQIFKRFGYWLKDPDTDIQLKIPSNFRVKHSFPTNTVSRAEDIMKVSWFSKLTQSSLYKTCVICNTSNSVEMHHIRHVKDVKNKIKTGNSTYQEWTGSYLRKQVPLCMYHHDLYHSGDLNYADMTKIRRYT
jgi:group II intron reverse transcriptase/maturase